MTETNLLLPAIKPAMFLYEVATREGKVIPVIAPGIPEVGKRLAKRPDAHKLSIQSIRRGDRVKFA